MLRLTTTALLAAACLHPTQDDGGGPVTAVAQPRPNTRPLTVPRVLCVYSNRWDGPRPAFVVNAFGAAAPYANVRVFVDLANDRGASSELNLTSVPVFEPMTPEQRHERLTSHDSKDPDPQPVYWAEWPTADATRSSGGVTPDIDARLKALGERLEKALADAETARSQCEQQRLQIEGIREVMERAIEKLNALASSQVPANRELNVDGEEAPEAATKGGAGIDSNAAAGGG